MKTKKTVEFNSEFAKYIQDLFSKVTIDTDGDHSEEINDLFFHLKQNNILDSEDEPHCSYLLKATEAEQVKYVIDQVIADDDSFNTFVKQMKEITALVARIQDLEKEIKEYKTLAEAKAMPELVRILKQRKF